MESMVLHLPDAFQMYYGFRSLFHPTIRTRSLKRQEMQQLRNHKYVRNVRWKTVSSRKVKSKLLGD